jgi:hypothetical protein
MGGGCSLADANDRERLIWIGGGAENTDTTLLDSLSSASRGVVNAALNLNIASRTGRGPETVEQFAGALLTPNVLLKERLQTASRELEGIVAQVPATDEVLSSSSEPPALSLPVLQFDDPQKGRFGGKSEADGFSLTASFSDPGDGRWIWIHLAVTAKPDVVLDSEAIAEFFLHDTFRRSRLSARLADGVAAVAIRAFGGFTVGAWVPSHQVELELDLAQLTYAPRAIKEW